MLFIRVTFEVFHADRLPLNFRAKVNMPLISVTFEVFHTDKSPLNSGIRRNIKFIRVTFEVSHADRLPLNSCALYAAAVLHECSLRVRVPREEDGVWAVRRDEEVVVVLVHVEALLLARGVAQHALHVLLI